MSYQKYNIIFIFIISLLLILFSEYIFDNYQLKLSSFAIEYTKTSSDNNIQKFIKNGDYNFEIIRDYHKAIEFYDKVLTMDSENVEALAKKAKTLARLYNFSESFELVDKALGIEPNSVIALDAKGFVLTRQGNYSEAIEYFDKAIAIDPNFLDALTDKGWALYDQGNYSEAIKYYD